MYLKKVLYYGLYNPQCKRCRKYNCRLYNPQCVYFLIVLRFMQPAKWKKNNYYEWRLFLSFSQS